LLAVRIAAPAFEFECEIVPALNTLLGFALVELKFAPDPTTSAAATISPAQATSTFRGEAFQRDVSLLIAISSTRWLPVGQRPVIWLY
jgi:hypothetical protein